MKVDQLKHLEKLLYFTITGFKQAFYFQPLPRDLRTHQINLAEELRLNLSELSSDERDEFEKYIDLSDSPKMTFIHENLRKTIWRH